MSNHISRIEYLVSEPGPERVLSAADFDALVYASPDVAIRYQARDVETLRAGHAGYLSPFDPSTVVGGPRLTGLRD